MEVWKLTMKTCNERYYLLGYNFKKVDQYICAQGINSNYLEIKTNGIAG